MLGLATLNRIRDVPPAQRPSTTLRDTACEPDELPLSRPDEPLVELLSRMRGCGDGRAVVLDHEERVIGIVSPTDISRVVQFFTCRSSILTKDRAGRNLTWSVPARR